MEWFPSLTDSRRNDETVGITIEFKTAIMIRMERAFSACAVRAFNIDHPFRSITFSRGNSHFNEIEKDYERNYVEEIFCFDCNCLRDQRVRHSWPSGSRGDQNFMESYRGARGSLFLPASLSVLV